MNWKPYSVHPFADEFPLIEGQEFTDLVADIQRNGLRDPITLTSDKNVIVDGRNRYRACLKAGVDPKFETLPRNFSEIMIADFIMSKNILRRQLSPSQVSFVAIAYKKIAEIETEKAKKEGGDKGRETQKAKREGEDVASASSGRSHKKEKEDTSAQKAAEKTGASATYIKYAEALEKFAPDLAKKVKAGELSLDAAYKQWQKRKRSQPKPDKVEKKKHETILLVTHEKEEIKYPKPFGNPTFNDSKGDGISWAKWSWNPVTGCLHGCTYCYARAIATNERFADGFPVGFTPLFHHERLDAPKHTKIPLQYSSDPYWKRVFVCSMADLYGRWVPQDWIRQVHNSMIETPSWEYLLLTKFPSRYVDLEFPKTAWVGTSVDEQKRVRFAEEAFREIKNVKVKWLSLEPLLAPLEFKDLSMFDWVVIGAQTETYQPNGTVKSFAPPFEWVARIVAQAREAGCKIHMKPNLQHAPGMSLIDEYPFETSRGMHS